MSATTARTCAFVTLGCKANQYDSQAIRHGLLSRGWTDAPPDSPADLYVVNTCTVTAVAGAKSRKEIRRIAAGHPGATLVVTGCYADSDLAVLKGMAGIDYIFTNKQKEQIAETLEREEPAFCRPGKSLDAEAHESCETPLRDARIRDFGNMNRAFVKIQDGCDLYCTYCIIPAVRGEVRSRGLAMVAGEVRGLVETGYREIVLTGIHVGAYGQDLGRPAALLELIRRLEEIEGLERLRLSSIEVQEVGPELVAHAARSRKFCPHLHLPLQSGSDRILKLMGRRYRAAEFLETCRSICARVADVALTTDVIVGFPGETDEDFDRTLRFCEEVGFARIHVFPYSDRRGTPAVRLGPKIAPDLKRSRVRRLEELGARLGLAYRRRFVGRTLGVLVENRRESRSGRLQGLTSNYIRVQFEGPDSLHNRIVEVPIEEARPECALGGLFTRLAFPIGYGREP